MVQALVACVPSLRTNGQGYGDRTPLELLFTSRWTERNFGIILQIMCLLKATGAVISDSSVDLLLQKMICVANEREARIANESEARA